jgi:hypothetical protein
MVTFYVLRFTFCSFALLTALSSLAAPIDESKLPPAAPSQIDFLRDIKPILDGSCLKCHGPEKPKSHFRVDDRAALLKGGDNGTDIIVGQSAKSPLIHYVARLVEDMEMPPPGKGEPLTAAQIGLLRAWIDQELPWGGVESVSKTVVEVAPTVGWLNVKGDEKKFRELNWSREGWNGGLDQFLIKQQLDGDRRFTMSGHALRDDYKLTLSLEKTEGMFVHAGFEQFRKYFDDSGGYYAPYAAGGLYPPFASLGRDLHLDLGKAWIEAGGVTPFGLQLTGGYEFHFKDGEKSLTQWKPTGPDNDPRNILPISKNIDETVHVLRLDAGYDVAGVRFDDRFRYEFHDLKTDLNTVENSAFSTVTSERVHEKDSLRNLANALSAETQPREWMLLSAGYLYSRTEGDTSYRLSPVDATGQPRATAGAILWNGQGLTLEDSAHIFNANAQLGLWEQMTLSSGVQTEWNHQRAFGEVNLDQIDSTVPQPPVITNASSGPAVGDYDRFTAEEKFTLRNTQIPFTVLYGEARFRQETIQQVEELDAAIDVSNYNFTRDTRTSRHWRQYRAGFAVSPWTRVSLDAYYQKRDRADDFNHVVDQRPATGGFGYPAFITDRDTETDEVGTKLALRPASWLKTTLAYRLVSTDYRTTTDLLRGFSLLSGEYDAHIYTLNATLTPWRRLYLFSTFMYQDTRTVAEDNASPSIVPFRGHIYSALTSANYVLNEQTDLSLTYIFSNGDYSQNNAAAGLPLGIDYHSHSVRAGLGRRFWKRFVANLEYVWSRYDEPSSGAFNDFTAHGVFATLRARWD